MAKTGPKGPSKYTPEFIEAQADAIILYAEREAKPTEQEYATTQSLDMRRFGEWCDPNKPTYNEKFSVALKRFKQIQYYKWLKQAADGLVPPAVFIFFAKNVLGMRDEQHIKGDLPQTNIIVVRNDGSKAQELSGRVRVLRGPLPGDGISLGNGQESLPDSTNPKTL